MIAWMTIHVTILSLSTPSNCPALLSYEHFKSTIKINHIRMSECTVCVYGWEKCSICDRKKNLCTYYSVYHIAGKHINLCILYSIYIESGYRWFFLHFHWNIGFIDRSFIIRLNRNRTNVTNQFVSNHSAISAKKCRFRFDFELHKWNKLLKSSIKMRAIVISKWIYKMLSWSFYFCFHLFISGHRLHT